MEEYVAKYRILESEWEDSEFHIMGKITYYSFKSLNYEAAKEEAMKFRDNLEKRLKKIIILEDIVKH